MKKIVIFCTLSLVLALSTVNCTLLDVVARDANKSFTALLENSTTGFDPGKKRWELQGPGSEIFSMASDFSTNEPDIIVTFPAAPFIGAGLDTAKLPSRILYDNASGILILRIDLSTSKLPQTAADSFANLFKEFVKVKRTAIGYHEALDHYGIALGDGNMFEWAKDLLKNDKDLVFVLNPEPFITAGLDTQKLTGWIYAEVPMKDEKGNPIKVFKILKPYNLK